MAKTKKRKDMLPGMEEKEIPVLSKQCERLVEKQAEKTQAAGAYKDVHDKLIELMHKHKLKVYTHNGKKFAVESTERAKFKNLKPQESNGVNPGSDDDDSEDDLADGDDIRPAQLKRKQTGKVPV